MSLQKRLWNDTARYETALDQAVRFVAKLSTLAREVVKQADEAVEGKNVVVRTKGSKLEIVAGTEHEFGQYLIDQSDQKWCEQNPDRDAARASGMPFRGNVAGHKYIEKTTGEKTKPHDDLKLYGGKSE